MKRFHHLIKEELDKPGMSYRKLAIATGLTPMAISDYVLLGKEPRLKAQEAIAAYLKEPVTTMLLEHSEDDCEVKIYKAIAEMTAKQKQQLLETIQTNYISATYSKDQPKPKQKGSASKTCEAL